MKKKEQQQWKNSMVDVLYPDMKDKFLKEMKSEIARLVALHVGKWLNMPLNVDQVASVMDEKKATIYKKIERGQLVFQCVGKKRYYITLQSLNIQLSGHKDRTSELLGNKSSKAKSGDSAGEAISEQ